MTEAIHEGGVISGPQLHQEVMKHFSSVNCVLPNPTPQNLPFPQLRLKKTDIIKMSQNIKANKAIAFDDLHESLFRFCKPSRDCPSQNCNMCLAKFKIISNFTKSEYWTESNKIKHFRARLVTLNKAHPETPKVNEYRPIVVCSSLIKFL